jgi:hypothetical protein
VRKEGKVDRNNDRKNKQKGCEVHSAERRKGGRGTKWIKKKRGVLKQETSHFLRHNSLPFL